MSANLQLVQTECRFHFIGRHNRAVIFSVLATSLDDALQQFRNSGHSPSDALFIIKTETQIFLAWILVAINRAHFALPSDRLRDLIRWMNLALPTEGLDRYTSPSQRARISTEPWGLANLYCPACDSPRIESLPTNTPAHDFKCPKCREWFQLKSQKRKLGNSLSDGAFSKMVEAIHQDKTPNLFALHYDANTWSVRNLILIPRFTYTLSVIKCRSALSPTAERHGWIGCSINLGLIPPEAKIPVIVDGAVKPSSEIRVKFRKLHKLGQKSVEARGWTLDVLNVIHSLGKREFLLQDVYNFESALARLHPSNRNIQPKIRQQLQELRKLGLLEFLKPGHYRIL